MNRVHEAVRARWPPPDLDWQRNQAPLSGNEADRPAEARGRFWSAALGGGWTPGMLRHRPPPVRPRRRGRVGGWRMSRRAVVKLEKAIAGFEPVQGRGMGKQARFGSVRRGVRRRLRGGPVRDQRMRSAGAAVFNGRCDIRRTGRCGGAGFGDQADAGLPAGRFSTSAMIFDAPSGAGRGGQAAAIWARAIFKSRRVRARAISWVMRMPVSPPVKFRRRT